MKAFKIFFIAMVAVMLVLSGDVVMAQCANCAATVESNSSNGGNEAAGLNNGILYLLAMPYIAAAVGGYIWYKKYRRKTTVELNMRNEKLHLN